MGPEELKEWEDKIDAMTHEEMARLWRFAPGDHPCFKEPLLYRRYKKRYDEFGGMTTALSKKIGWENRDA